MWYVGHMKLTGCAVAEEFESDKPPTKATHGRRYFAVTGPFRTKRGAEYLADNPLCLTVDEAERLAESDVRTKYPALFD